MLRPRDITAVDLFNLLFASGFAPVLATTDIGHGKGAMKRYNDKPVMVSADGRYIIFHQGLWLPAIKLHLRHYKPPRPPVIILQVQPEPVHG